MGTWADLRRHVQGARQGATARRAARSRTAEPMTAAKDSVRPVGELRDAGLLWLINATVFHPRGYALALHVDDSGAVVGWSLMGDGSEPWRFANDMDARFAAAEQTLRDQR